MKPRSCALALLAIASLPSLDACSSGPATEVSSSVPVSAADATAADATVADATADAPPSSAETSAPDPTSCSASAGRLDLNDVSFLFPLPTADAGPGQLLSLSDTGPKGVLLSAGVADGLPKPLARFPEEMGFSDVRIVAARVDPCFVVSATTCRKQLRLVGQALAGARTVDATVHLFYDLANADFAALVTRLRALKKTLAIGETDCKPLGVHPAMVREGLGGAYATTLRALILDMAGAANLSRVAIMALGRPGAVWDFAAFDVVGGQAVADAVVGLAGAKKQAFTLSDSAQGTGFFSVAAGATLPLLFHLEKLSMAPKGDVESAVREAFAIENPTRHNPGTVDCVSCHVADRGRRQAASVRAVTLDGAVERFVTGAFDLSLAPDGRKLESQRAFGYIDAAASISQRTVNESAEVAKAINAMP